MKKWMILWVVCSAVFLAAAPENLLPAKLTVSNPKTTVFKDGVYTITNPDTKVKSIVSAKVTLNQKTPGPITFSVEARAMENVGSSGCYFGALIDVVHTDNTRVNGINFGMGKDTFDWRTASRVYIPQKPVKEVIFYFQYIRNKGKVAFRNPVLLNGRPAPAAKTAKKSVSGISGVPYDKLGKHKITVVDRNLQTVLVRNGRPAAAIVGAPELARIVNAAIQARTGTTLPVLPHTAYENADKLDRNLIVLGSRDNNRTMSNLYCRHFAMIDGKYPGPGGHDVHSLHNPFGDKFNVILAGGSDPAGDRKSAEILAKYIRKGETGKSFELGFISDAKLSPSYKVARDVKDIPLWEYSIGYENKGYFGWNSLARNLAMLYITNDPYYKNEFMRLAFPKDKKTQDELFRRDDEAYHDDPSEPIVKVYHYRGQYMTLYWDMVDENPLFTDEERRQVNQKLYDQLVFRLTRNDYTNPYRKYNERKVVRPDRHATWEVLTAYTAARFLHKDFPCFDTREGLRLGSNAIEPLLEKNAVDNIALFWVITSSEMPFYYAKLQGHRLVGNSTLKEIAKSLTMISTLGKGSDDRNGVYGAAWHLFNGAFFAQDQGMITLAKRRTMPGTFAAKAVHDYNVFRVGQSYWPAAEYPNDSIKDNLGKWIRYDVTKTTDLSKTELLYVSYRSKADGTGDYMMVDPHYSTGLRDPQHNFAMLFAHIGGMPALHGYENALVPYANGLNIGKFPFDAEIVAMGAEAPFSWITGRIRNYNGFDWERTWLLREGKYLTAIDKIKALQDHAAARYDVKYTAGFNGKVQKMADGDFKATTTYNGKTHSVIWSFSDDVPVLHAAKTWSIYLPGDAVTFQPVKTDLTKGSESSYVTLLRPGEALDTRGTARDGDLIALRTPEPVLITLTGSGFTLAGADATFTLAGKEASVSAGDAAAAEQAMQLLKKRDRKPFTPPAIAEESPLMSNRWIAHLAHKPGRIVFHEDQFGIASGNTFTVFNSVSGKTVFRAELDAPVYSVAYHPEAKLWLAGAKNEILTAFDERGKVQWTFQSEMAKEVLNYGPYWHKSSVPGVRSLFVRDGRIFAGSAATMEVLDAKGKLLERKFIRYGGIDDQVWNPESGKIMMIRPSGGAGLLDMDPKTFAVRAQDHWGLGMQDNLHGYGFNQVAQYQVLFFKNSKGNILAADLLGGAQNRFIIRSAKGATLYEANFGPGRLGYNLMFPAEHDRTLRNMAMTDWDNDGKQEFAVSHANGSLYIFNEKAEVVKLFNLFNTALSLAAGKDAFYAGLADGRILKADVSGVRTVARVKGKVYLLEVLENGHILAGCSNGDLTLF